MIRLCFIRTEERRKRLPVNKQCHAVFLGNCLLWDNSMELQIQIYRFFIWSVLVKLKLVVVHLSQIALKVFYQFPFVINASVL